MDKKAKEPLLAVMLSFIYSGLGHMYSGYFKRGMFFIIFPILIVIGLYLYVTHPETKFYSWFIGIGAMVIIFDLYIKIDSYLCAKRYNRENNLKRKITAGKRILYILGIIIIPCIINIAAPSNENISIPIALYIRANVIQAFKIPSGTMSPTLVAGDRLLVDKRVYKATTPQRGDVIAFRYPKDKKRDFLKRLIALEGEVIEIIKGDIFINGEMMMDPVIKNIYYYKFGDFFMKHDGKVRVPKDHVFVLGDNSKSSSDSRIWGFVPVEDIIGKALKIYYPFDRSGLIK